MTDLKAFVRESNRIEGIEREPLPEEVAALEHFLGLENIEVRDLELLVETFQPGARLRNKPYMDVMVGNYIAPPGGPNIAPALQSILDDVWRGDPYTIHQQFEHLHPFQDGNGRSGRALWLWMMEHQGGAPLGFLHTYYYQSLAAIQGKVVDV